MIGPFNSPCAQIEIPILNRAPGGPLAMISPSNTHAGLTRLGAPARGLRGEPDVYYPTGERNYVRLPALDNMHGAAHAMLAQQLGLRACTCSTTGRLLAVLLSDPFRYAAQRLGVRDRRLGRVRPEAKDYAALADRIEVRRGRPRAGGDPSRAATGREGAARPVRHAPDDHGLLLLRLRPRGARDRRRRARAVRGTARHAARRARSTPAAAVQPRPSAGRATASMLEAAQATELVLDAIARSDGAGHRCSSELGEG